MMSKNKEDNGSTKNSKGMTKDPTWIKLKSCTVAPPPFLTSKKINKLTTKEASIAPDPMIPIMDLDNDFLKSPLTRKPSNGKRGTK